MKWESLVNKKLKSFGLIESLVASFVVLVVIGAAVGLASSSTKTSSASVSKIIASDISKSTMEKLIFLNRAKLIDYDGQTDRAHLSCECLDTVFISNGQEGRACTDSLVKNRLSPYYPYLVQDEYFNPKNIQDGKILIENSFGRFNLGVRAKTLSSTELIADISVDWLDSQVKKQIFNNQVILTR